MKKYILNIIGFFIIGGILGVLVKFLDIYDGVQHFGFTFGNMFSELSIWILFGVLISIYSGTKYKAMGSVLSFCLGMLLTYYVTAELTNSVYGMSFVKGWLCFSLFSPFLAYLTWLTKEKGIIPKIISGGIIFVTLAADIVIFGGPRWYDIVIVIVLIYLLFVKKIDRNNAVSK